MITRMTVKFNETKEDAYQGLAVKARFNKLNEKNIFTKFYKTKTHLHDHDKDPGFDVYYDYVVYFNDVYEDTVMKALRPYYALQ